MHQKDACFGKNIVRIILQVIFSFFRVDIVIIMAELARRQHFKNAIYSQLQATTRPGFENVSIIEIEVMLEKLVELMGKFESAHLRVIELTYGEDETQSGFFEEVNDKYLEEVIKLKTMLKEKQTSGLSVNPVQVPPVVVDLSVGSINIEPFNGDYSDWQRFHDLFKATIHDKPTIAPVIKFGKLLGLLGPDVKPLLAGYQQTDDNYEEAWKALKERYNNKESIVFALLNRLMELPSTSQNDGKSFWKLVDAVNEIMRQLRILKIPVDHWGVLFVFLVLKRLDGNTRRDWELSRANNTNGELSKISELLQFLGRQASSILFMQQQEVPKQLLPASGYLNDRKIRSCVLCGETHRLYRCGRFKSQSLPDRLKTVRLATVCPNCLLDHGLENCSQSKCRVCFKGKHNIWLR